MESHLIGEAAALAVSFLWTFCSLFFTAAGKRIGALNVNAIRIMMAAALLGTAHLALFGFSLPSANGAQWFYMGLSGIIGLSLGDLCYFGCLVTLGPEKGSLSWQPILFFRRSVLPKPLLNLLGI